MRVCIVGGGKIGYYLAKTLMEHGHTPVLIEKNDATCRADANSLDITVIHGDGSKPDVLENAGLSDCAALVAVTGRDESNLTACQLAKSIFAVKRTVARVNNPKNAKVLKELGVDTVVSSTDNLARLIEREVETSAIRQVLSLAGGSAALTEVVVPSSFPYDGHTLAQLPTPRNVSVVSVTRGNDFIIPNGTTEIHKGDKVLVLGSNAVFPEFTRAWRLVDMK